jgi:cytochrome c556
MPSSRRDTTRISGSSTDCGARAVAGRSWVRPLAGLWLVAGGAGFVLMTAVAVGRPPVADQVAGFMRAKLGHSQNVLEGLSTADFDLIERGAQELSLASQDSNWQVLQTEDYIRQSAEFRRACDALRTAAQAKNLDGAALAWMDVTLKCVQCHKYVRDVE